MTGIRNFMAFMIIVAMTVFPVCVNAQPSPPTELEARSSADSVKLIWEPGVADIDGYNVYRSDDNGASYEKINPELAPNRSYYMDNSDLNPDTTYFYYLKAVDTSGSESEPSNTASVFFGQLKFFIPDSKGEPGEENIRVPVNIANADGLNMCSVDIYVTYDPNVLEATDIERTPLSADYGWVKNLETPGIARAVIATGQGETLFGEGTLFYVMFKVLGNHGDTTDLELEATGTYFYECDDLFNEVPLDLSDAGVFTVSEACGFLGDVNEDCRINSADSALVLRIAVGKMEPTPTQFYAAEVSGDGFVRSNDSVLIMLMAAELPLFPDGNERRMAFRSTSVNLSVPNLTLPAGGSIWVPIDISNDASKVMGSDIVLNYDSSLIKATDVRTTSMTKDFNVAFNVLDAGQIRIAFSAKEVDSLPSEDSGSLVEVQFTTKSDATTGTSYLALAIARLNDAYSRDFATSALQVDVSTTRGNLRVVSLYGAISVLKVLAGMDVDDIRPNMDINDDEKIGMEEAVYILKALAGMK